MDGEVGKFIRGNIEKVGLTPFEAVWDNGFRQITSSTRPIKAPEDLANFKIRVPVVPLWVAMFSAFGAAPVSIPLNEAYSALQTKIADGQENPLALIESAKFYEVQKFCSLTNHSWDGFWLISSGKIWKTLPKDVQEVLQKHFNAAAKKQRDDIVKANVDYQKVLEVEGPDLQHDRCGSLPGGARQDLVLQGRQGQVWRRGLGAAAEIRRQHRVTTMQIVEQMNAGAAPAPPAWPAPCEKPTDCWARSSRSPRRCWWWRKSLFSSAVFPPAICFKSPSSGRTSLPAFSSCGWPCWAPSPPSSAASTCG